MRMNLSPEHEVKLNEAFSRHLGRIMAAQEMMDEKQIFDCFVQALIAGDFVKQVVQGNGAQNFIYLPYRECDRLRNENDRLRLLCAKHGIDPTLTGEAYELCGELTTTQARLAEAIALLDEFSHRSLFGNSQLSSDGHLGICSVRGVKPEECRVCGTTIRTLNFLSSTEPPAILKELEELHGLIRGIRVCLQCGDADIEKTLMDRMHQRAQEFSEFCKLKDKLAEAEKDKARLDWLDEQNLVELSEHAMFRNCLLRDAIDAAMKRLEERV